MLGSPRLELPMSLTQMLRWGGFPEIPKLYAEAQRRRATEFKDASSSLSKNVQKELHTAVDSMKPAVKTVSFHGLDEFRNVYGAR